MEDMHAFGRNVRLYRKNLHLSQEVLSEKLDINPSNITKIENGDQFVSSDVLYKLAEKLQVTVSDLFKTDETPISPATDSAGSRLKKYILTLNDEEAEFAYENIKLFKKYFHKNKHKK